MRSRIWNQYYFITDVSAYINPSSGQESRKDIYILKIQQFTNQKLHTQIIYSLVQSNIHHTLEVNEKSHTNVCIVSEISGVETFLEILFLYKYFKYPLSLSWNLAMLFSMMRCSFSGGSENCLVNVIDQNMHATNFSWNI